MTRASQYVAAVCFSIVETTDCAFAREEAGVAETKLERISALARIAADSADPLAREVAVAALKVAA